MLDELIAQEICFVVKNTNNIKLSEKSDVELKIVQKTSGKNAMINVNNEKKQVSLYIF